MIHELKTVNPYFRKVALGIKTFELRKNDRNFKQFDELILKEYDAKNKTYSGNFIRATVKYMIEGYEGLEKGYCILGIRVNEININD